MPAFVLLLLTAIALPPKPDHYVTDRAGVLFNPAALDAKLADFERKTSDQILVYVDRHLPPDTTIEEMGSEAMRKWGVGQKGKDNGAILFVFVGDRKMRIEVGYGLEGSLTDAKSKWITSTLIKPEFQRGNYGAGIEKGVDAMMATVRGEAYRGTLSPSRSRSRVGGRLVAEQLAKRASSAAVPWLVMAFGFLFIGTFVAFILWLVFRGRKSGAVTWSGTGGSGFSSDSSSSRSSDSSSSSSSDSSSSFDGGGGSGGGGGASDSW
jgi:uncharacterized protein